MEETREISLAEKLKGTKEGRCRLLTERAIIRVTEQLEEAMDVRGMSRADLARELGRTKGWVTQLLDGENNKTIRTVAYVFAVLGAEMETGYSFPDCARPGHARSKIRVTFDVPVDANLFSREMIRKGLSTKFAIKRKISRHLADIALTGGLDQ